MNVASFSSRFSDALTFKEWLKTVYVQDKGLIFNYIKNFEFKLIVFHFYSTKNIIATMKNPFFFVKLTNFLS